jgi:hypothetical protein
VRDTATSEEKESGLMRLLKNAKMSLSPEKVKTRK